MNSETYVCLVIKSFCISREKYFEKKKGMILKQEACTCYLGVMLDTVILHVITYCYVSQALPVIYGSGSLQFTFHGSESSTPLYTHHKLMSRTKKHETILCLKHTD